MIFKAPAIPTFTGGIKMVITLIAHKERKASLMSHIPLS